MEALQQRLVFRRVGRDVNLQQQHAAHFGFDARVAEGKRLHFLAGHAPVGVEVEHHRPARGLEPCIQLGKRADALELLERVPGLELTLDYSHFVYQGIAESEIEALAPFARHCHVRGARQGRMQAPLRESQTDFERMVDVLGDADYDGFVGLEYVWLDWEHCNECDNLSETILLRDRLREKFAGREWRYPEMVV